MPTLSLDEVAQWALGLTGGEFPETSRGESNQTEFVLGYVKHDPDGTTHSMRIARHAIFSSARWFTGVKGLERNTKEGVEHVHLVPHQPTLYRIHASTLRGPTLVSLTKSYLLFIPGGVTLVDPAATQEAAPVAEAAPTSEIPPQIWAAIVHDATEFFANESLRLGHLAYALGNPEWAAQELTRIRRWSGGFARKLEALSDQFGFQTGFPQNRHQVGLIISGALRYLDYMRFGR